MNEKKYIKNNIEILKIHVGKWPGGSHYYASIGSLDICLSNGIKKWHTAEDAMYFSEKYILENGYKKVGENEFIEIREELKMFINDSFSNINLEGIIQYIKNNHFNIYNKIIKETSYLSKNCKFTERLYHILKDLYKIPRCYCNNELKFISMNKGYLRFCSTKCMSNNREIREKIEKTNLEKYGNKTPLKNGEIKEKIKKTKKERYGNENYVNSDKAKQTKEIKYGNENYNNIEKNKQTKKERYGNENYVNSDKAKQTKKEIYGDENFNNFEQVKSTNLKKYNCEYPLQNKKILNKLIETNEKKYGVKYNFQNEEIKMKIEKTKLINFYNKLLKSDRLKDKVEPLFQFEDYKGIYDDDGKAIKYKFKCKICENEFEDNMDNGKIPICRICFPVESHYTIPHQRISQFLSENNINYEIEKYIEPYFIDVFIKPNKIIEVCGDFWHANPEFYSKEDVLKYPNKEKTAQEIWNYDEKRINYLKSKGYEILNLWEYEINNDFEKIEERISNYLGININKNEKFDFKMLIKNWLKEIIQFEENKEFFSEDKK